MRLTKRQLKRIIREEYSRLKRRGLIKESAGDQMGQLRSMIVSHYSVDMSPEYSETAADAWIAEVRHCIDQEQEGQDGLALEALMKNMKKAFGLNADGGQICDLAAQIVESESMDPYGDEMY